MKKISSALISVFNKEGLAPIIDKLQELNITIYSTGGTETFIRDMGGEVIPIEELTDYPSILGGRVKTLHPKVFGGILNRRSLPNDQKELSKYKIPPIDLVIVDLYPFEETIASTKNEEEIIEKIDIGGISLIRAAAKNFNDVLCVSNRKDYTHLLTLLNDQNGETSLQNRKYFAAKAFNISSHYDTAIFNYLNEEKEVNSLKISKLNSSSLRYGENPHQKGIFYGELEKLFTQLHGKQMSYNNLLDVDAAINLLSEFKEDEPTFGILKHNNSCGLATRNSLSEAYTAALEGDPQSAFGGVLIANRVLDFETAQKIHPLFCEVIIAPSFEEKSIDLLKQKKNRILLVQKQIDLPKQTLRTCLNGYLSQEKDLITDNKEHIKVVTKQAPYEEEISDLLFASKICKHTKSNTIVLVKNKQLIASGTGQTSRIDALKQAIEKAKQFGFSLKNAVMASDAFFPFPDCVEVAYQAGIHSVIQPGGSIKDNLSIDFCDSNGMSMIFTGIRHFKH